PMAHRLVALTPSEMKEHLELRVGREAQWTTVHSGIDFRPFEAARGEREAVRRELGIPPGATVLGAVARLVPIKGHTHLIDACARLKATHPDFHLLLAGDGTLHDHLVRQAQGSGLTVRGAGSGKRQAKTGPAGRPLPAPRS